MNDEQKNSSNDLRISESQIRVAVALMLLVVGFLCVVSYHWGKKKAYEEFVDNLRGETLGDKVSAALCSVYDVRAGDDAADDTSDARDEEAPATDAVSSPENSKRYCAELVGFGSEESAKRYVSSLGQRDISARVIKRTSKTARGATRSWYQVVTSPMAFDELQNTVNRIKTRDRLKNIAIVESKEETER